MRSGEFTGRRRNGLVALTLTGALALAGCGKSSPAEATPAASPAVAAPAAEQYVNQPVIGTQYYPNGTRIITFAGSAARSYSTILDFCDNGDLVEQTSVNFGAGNNVERTFKHPACDDGMLTQSDFEQPR